MIPVEKIVSGIAKEKWYYSLELSPGLFTQGANHVNIIPVRMALAATEIEGKRCLDIGTQDGLVPILLARRKAAYIAAQDVVDRKPKIQLVKGALDIEFDYFGGLPLEKLRPTVMERNLFPFDVTIFSGVLYHMIDPFVGLAIARSFVRTGGLLIVETVTALDNTMVMHFNAAGRYNKDAGSYFIFSTACLDYMLRLLRLEPIDCLYTKPYLNSGLPISRVCVVCRAKDSSVLGPNDTSTPNERHFGQYINWHDIHDVATPVPYMPIVTNRILRDDSGCVDIHQTILNNPAIDTDQPELLRLAGNDMY